MIEIQLRESQPLLSWIPISSTRGKKKEGIATQIRDTVSHIDLKYAIISGSMTLR